MVLGEYEQFEPFDTLHGPYDMRVHKSLVCLLGCIPYGQPPSPSVIGHVSKRGVPNSPLTSASIDGVSSTQLPKSTTPPARRYIVEAKYWRTASSVPKCRITR